ncbi:EAL domain-containing protein [Devosia sp. WQ 349]|nr:EAL domain-containing protein [Devosia sp. WQ 349K1]
MSMENGNGAVSDDQLDTVIPARVSEADVMESEEAERLLADLSAGRLTLVQQGIHQRDNPQHTLYHECLLRRCSGELNGPSLFIGIAAAERLGRIRPIDHFVALTVAQWLIDQPEARLGVNISANSAVLDDQWGEFFALVDAHAGVATRLVVEVTETAALPVGYGSFIEALRSRGIKIALDDYGVGHSTQERLTQIRPDIVKINGHYTRNARQGEPAAIELRGVAQDLRAFGGVLVLEGIETEFDRNTAFMAGISWIQGFGVSQ